MQNPNHLQSRAEAQLVSALKTSRAVPRKIGGPGKAVRVMDENNGSSSQYESEQSDIREETPSAGKTVPPRPPVLSQKQEEIMSVRVLDVPSYDGTRQFPGLAKQKVVKKERHIKTVEEFTHLLDTVSEGIEQDVLSLSRSMKDDIETIDNNLENSYKLLKSPDYLIPMNEKI